MVIDGIFFALSRDPRSFSTSFLGGFISHRIHGAAIYGNMDPINIPSKFREVLFICPICVYGPILLAGGVNMRLRCIKKKIVRHERILGNLTTHVRKTHLPTFTMNAGNHRKKIVHVARSIFCVICVFNVFWVAGTLISLFSVK